MITIFQIFLFILYNGIKFLYTTLIFWLLTLLLPVFGIIITFSWGKALVFWVIAGLIQGLLS